MFKLIKLDYLYTYYEYYSYVEEYTVITKNIYIPISDL